MSFHNFLFPTDISINSRSSLMHRTEIIRTESGQEFRNVIWASPLHAYDAAWDDMPWSALKTIYDFAVAREGNAHTFPWKDPLNFTTDPNVVQEDYPDGGAPSDTDVLIGIGDGTTTVFQLKVVKGEAGFEQSYPVTKPVSGSVVISLDDVSQASGWSVDHLTGLVTFSVAPTLGVDVKAGFNYNIPVRFNFPQENQAEVLTFLLSGYDNGSAEAIPLIEDRTVELPLVENLPKGGAQVDVNFGGVDKNLEFANGLHVYIVTLGSSGLKLRLPSTAGLELGGPYSIITHAAGANDFDLVTNSDAVVVADFEMGQTYEIHLITVSGVKTWLALLK